MGAAPLGRASEAGQVGEEERGPVAITRYRDEENVLKDLPFNLSSFLTCFLPPAVEEPEDEGAGLAEGGVRDGVEFWEKEKLTMFVAFFFDRKFFRVDYKIRSSFVQV